MSNIRMRLGIAWLIILSLCFGALSQTALRSGFDRNNMDTSVAACQDFNMFANGGWIKSNPVPAAYSRWGSFSVLAERNRDTLHQILDEAAAKPGPKGSSMQKIGDLYADCMDETKIEAADAAPLKPLLLKVDAIKTQQDLQRVVAELHVNTVPAMFTFGAGPDAKHSTDNIGNVGQGGLSLPDRDYYLNMDDKSKETRAEFVKHVKTMLSYAGVAAGVDQTEADAILALETRLAKVSLSRVERRDPNKNYHKMTAAELQALTPNFSWADYFKAMGHPGITSLNVAHPDFLKGLDQELAATSIADWKSYLRWHVIRDTAPFLSARFDTENFNFYSKYLQGTKEQLPRWKRCVQVVDGTVGELLGQEYVKRAFPPNAKVRMATMVNNLIAVLREDLAKMSWMSETTRTKALQKLDAFTRKIGYTDKWRDYSLLKIDRTSYADNILRASRFERQRDLDDLGKPVDKTRWGMTPPTVNAYYNPLYNEIVFPAGILQPPFFDFSADDAINYGGIGAVIGHEMSHGFDDQGRQFDASGNLNDWWTKEDAVTYKQRADCIVEQFSTYKVSEGLFQNGQLVLGESIGDLGGLTLAYRAYQKSLNGQAAPVIDGFTGDQRFFFGWAQVWAANSTPQAEVFQAKNDPHPLARFRVNGPLSNLPEFSGAFGCKAGDPMVRQKRCEVW